MLARRISLNCFTYNFSNFMVKERKGLASGLLVGLFIGIVFDNIALGIIFGLLFGGAFDHHQKPKSDEPD